MSEYRPYNRSNRYYWQSPKNDCTRPMSNRMAERQTPQQPECHEKKKQPKPMNSSVGMAYVPWQQWDEVYNLDDALQNGTLFPELDKKFYCSGGGCK